jgi:hypothetical protein
VADVESKLRQDITPAPDADPLLGPDRQAAAERRAAGSTITARSLSG